MKKLVVLGLLTLCAGCQQKGMYKVSFYSSDGEKLVEDGDFYITKNESPYFYINDNPSRKKIFESIIDSIEFTIGEKQYIAKPVRLMFSDRNPYPSDFLFSVDNTSKKIVHETIENKEMFTLASKKTDITSLIGKGNLKAKKLK